MTMDADADIVRAKEPTDGLEDFKLVDTYKEWLKSEGVKVIVDFAFDDLAAVELGPWERKGGKGAVINIPYDVLTNDSQLIEINPGGRSEPEHHMYEEYVYVVAGRGATTLWPIGGEKRTFEWKKGSLFSIPLNCWYEHFNGSGSEPAWMTMGTCASDSAAHAGSRTRSSGANPPTWTWTLNSRAPDASAAGT